MRHDFGEGLIQKIPFQEHATAGDVARLQVLLQDVLVSLRFHRAYGSGGISTSSQDLAKPLRKIAVLNLACGRADETGALAGALAPLEISLYLGIDLRAVAIEEAQRRWNLATGNIEFRCGDASSIDKMRQLPEFDIIFIRHQNYWQHPVVWDRLLGNALTALAPGGVLACTSYFDREHDLLKASLKTRGAELLWDARHAASRSLDDAPGKSVDRRLAVFAKSAGQLERS